MNKLINKIDKEEYNIVWLNFSRNEQFVFLKLQSDRVFCYLVQMESESLLLLHHLHTKGI